MLIAVVVVVVVVVVIGVYFYLVVWHGVCLGSLRRFRCCGAISSLTKKDWSGNWIV
jgi:hypothetical protein